MKTPRLPFGLSLTHAARCVGCGCATMRRVTRDLGWCKGCEDARLARDRPPAVDSGTP
jgi:hypothetical protein